jgi:hypothetical protein
MVWTMKRRERRGPGKGGAAEPEAKALRSIGGMGRAQHGL